jgi:hypothetical protein
LLWAITSYFNSAGYRSRLRNYKIFKSKLAVPLAAVEFSPTGNFELDRDDADILLQITNGDVLWQKERLLNLALSSLPGDCDEVAWIDCDVIFTNPGWPAQVSTALDAFTLVQLFGERCNLKPGGCSCSEIESGELREAVARKICSGTVEALDLRDACAPLTKSTAGLAWAMRRDVLAAHGFYDPCVLGSGDRAILCAALGQFDYGIETVAMRGRQIEHYLDWAKPFHERVRGKVGYIDGRICHLWHGELENRRYRQRHEGLGPFGFDPFTDVVISPSGCWRWSGNKAAMHEYVRRYFELRKEDG